jgi:hypothetical protein
MVARHEVPLQFGHLENDLSRRGKARHLACNWADQDGLLPEEGKAGRLTYGG